MPWVDRRFAGGNPCPAPDSPWMRCILTVRRRLVLAGRRQIPFNPVAAMKKATEFQFLFGDCVEGVRFLPEQCVEVVVTSPPSHEASNRVAAPRLGELL